MRRNDAVVARRQDELLLHVKHAPALLDFAIRVVDLRAADTQRQTRRQHENARETCCETSESLLMAACSCGRSAWSSGVYL